MDTQIKFPRTHASLYVSNLENTIDFYTRLFGEAPVKVKPGYTKFELQEPGLIISFIENKDAVKSNFGHLGIQLGSVEELTQKQQELTDSGLSLMEEKDTRCCYARQDKFWVSDPDGVKWEYYYFHEDTELNDPLYSGEGEEATACCSSEMKVDGNATKVQKSACC